ncbi:small polypeptide DEVIL 10 [Ziziphus jujuba]|uniref:Small polypeptide DEVIL 10 n=1 Tax=Ziziphus jujuba TaxID=326968 RepID=A0A6P4AXU9_ZIZJJ|nr:small polypeptide DEVIL 10 [Ziziphus jujuba]
MAVSSYYLTPTSRPCKINNRKTGLRKRCFLMVKQQKTRFYILGRCISMLLCWQDHAVSD